MFSYFVFLYERNHSTISNFHSSTVFYCQVRSFRKMIVHYSCKTTSVSPKMTCFSFTSMLEIYTIAKQIEWPKLVSQKSNYFDLILFPFIEINSSLVKDFRDSAWCGDVSKVIEMLYAAMPVDIICDKYGRTALMIAAFKNEFDVTCCCRREWTWLKEWKMVGRRFTVLPTITQLTFLERCWSTVHQQSS